MSESKYCLVVPHYNHLPALQQFLPTLLGVKLPCIIVDDGSLPEVKAKLRALLAQHSEVELFEHAQNRGKGFAILSGAAVARNAGFTHILQIDADGQHDITDINKFMEYSKAHPEQLVSGAPLFDDSAPKARLYGRKVTNFWVALETLSLGFKDSLCGFRVYPLAQLEQVVARHRLGARMDFDTEILVRSAWQGIPVYFIDTKVIYLANSVSHFHYLRDNVSLVWLHIRLMTGMLIRLPILLFRRLRGHSTGAAG